MKKCCGLLIMITLLFQFQGFSQVSITGLADFEARLAGEDSSPYVNQTPGDKFSIYTPNLRLFISGNLSEQWFVNSVLQADHYAGKKLSNAFFSVFNINWTPGFDSDLVLTAGRFVTPYGSYADRFLSAQNPFVHLPMSHAAGLPVSKRFGHLGNALDDPARITELYGEDEFGSTQVYTRMYTQGIKLSHAFGESDWLSFDAAFTNAPASIHYDYGENESPSFIGRVVFKPVIWAEMGVSYSSGSFLKKDAANDSLLIYDLSSYKQKLLGADLSFNYRYYTLNLEWNNSFWKAPYYDQTTSGSDSPRTGLATINHYSGELVVDLPFLVGGYTAFRYEIMEEGEIEVYERDAQRNKINQTTSPWTYNRQRIEFVAGYKLQRNVILKGSYLFSDDDGPDLDDNVFALQLSVLF